MMDKLKKIKIKDLLGSFKFIIIILPALFYKLYLKLTHKKVWLLSETINLARDNGFAFYKYLKKEHPEIKSFYAINKKSSDYERVKPFGNIIQWSSFKHYFYYLACEWNISSHKGNCNPNQTLFTILHLYLNLFNNRIFLQHGILYQNLKMFHQKNTKFRLFICGAKPEYEFIKEKYGYQNDEVKYTGLARFDYLYDQNVKDEKIILLIPTWRRWLDTEKKFKESEYFQSFLSLLNNKELEEILEKYDKYLYFYPHTATQQYIHLYTKQSDRIKILTGKDVFVQDLLKKGSLLITDYSSIVSDFAYMHKPVIYYQFGNRDQFFQNHYSDFEKSYFDYDEDGFGPVAKNEQQLNSQILESIQENFKIKKIYEERVNSFFELQDQNNCKRIFDEIIRISKNGK